MYSIHTMLNISILIIISSFAVYVFKSETFSLTVKGINFKFWEIIVNETWRINQEISHYSKKKSVTE